VKLKLLTLATTTFGLLAIVLASGIYSGCGYCGPGVAVLWAIATVTFPTLSCLKRRPRNNGSCLNHCSSSDHEYFWDEREEVMAWHGNVPIWGKVKAKRCSKCEHEEAKYFQALG
jgi:hypothetical protein